MAGEASEESTQRLRRGSGDGMYTRETHATREAPRRGAGITNRNPVRDRPGALGWRRGPQCVPGSRRFRWVEVPLDPRPRVDIQHVGVMPHGPGDVDKQSPKRARSWKRRTQPRDALSSHPVDKTTGGQGVHREVESEGLEEHHRVVIEGSHPEDEPVGQRRGMVEPALRG